MSNSLNDPELGLGLGLVKHHVILRVHVTCRPMLKFPELPSQWYATMVSSSSANVKRPVPFTPKRPLSVASNEPPNKVPRSTTPSILSSARKFKATLTAE